MPRYERDRSKERSLYFMCRACSENRPGTLPFSCIKLEIVLE